MAFVPAPAGSAVLTNRAYFPSYHTAFVSMKLCH